MLEPDQRLWPYVVTTSIILFLTIMISLQFLIGAPRKFNHILLVIYWVILLGDAICILISAFLLLSLSKNLESSEKNKFKQEKDWFWSIIALSVILLFNWTMETIYSPSENSILFNFANVFTAFNFFVVFILKDNVQTLIFKKYRNLRRNESDF